MVTAVEFLAKQALPFKGHRDDKVDFTCEDANRGNNSTVSCNGQWHSKKNKKKKNVNYREEKFQVHKQDNTKLNHSHLCQ